MPRKMASAAYIEKDVIDVDAPDGGGARCRRRCAPSEAGIFLWISQVVDGHVRAPRVYRFPLAACGSLSHIRFCRSSISPRVEVATSASHWTPLAAGYAAFQRRQFSARHLPASARRFGFLAVSPRADRVEAPKVSGMEAGSDPSERLA